MNTKIKRLTNNPLTVKQLQYQICANLHKANARNQLTLSQLRAFKHLNVYSLEMPILFLTRAPGLAPSQPSPILSRAHLPPHRGL